jgi:hypothetical protein
MNARVGIAVLIVVLVVAIALVLRPSSIPVAVDPIVDKPPELVMDDAAKKAMQQASAVSTKQANAVQANAAKIAAEVKPSLEGYGFLTENSELILSYTVNFNPKENTDNTDKYAALLAKDWKIKELEAYKPKKITIEFYGGKERVKATRTFDPTGKPL